ncbi:DMT family transporter [Bacillus licheniformis]|nr:DMT family transporter [Bacillus licheniformis]
MLVLLFLHRSLSIGGYFKQFTNSKTFVTSSPWWLWTGGILGVVFITSNICFADCRSVSYCCLALSGQMIIALVIDHFGWFGIPKHRLNVQRILGIVLMITGIMIIQHFDASHFASSAGWHSRINFILRNSL